MDDKTRQDKKEQHRFMPHYLNSEKKYINALLTNGRIACPDVLRTLRYNFPTTTSARVPPSHKKLQDRATRQETKDCYEEFFAECSHEPSWKASRL